MTEKRRRNCKGCGKWLQYGDDEQCRECDPECLECGDRESAVEQFKAGMCPATCYTPEAEAYHANRR
jgi:hypothetical protein